MAEAPNFLPRQSQEIDSTSNGQRRVSFAQITARNPTVTTPHSERDTRSVIQNNVETVGINMSQGAQVDQGSSIGNNSEGLESMDGIVEESGNAQDFGWGHESENYNKAMENASKKKH